MCGLGVSVFQCSLSILCPVCYSEEASCGQGRTSNCVHVPISDLQRLQNPDTAIIILMRTFMLMEHVTFLRRFIFLLGLFT